MTAYLAGESFDEIAKKFRRKPSTISKIVWYERLRQRSLGRQESCLGDSRWEAILLRIMAGEKIADNIDMERERAGIKSQPRPFAESLPPIKQHGSGRCT
jgi:hypothetical protein